MGRLEGAVGTGNPQVLSVERVMNEAEKTLEEWKSKSTYPDELIELAREVIRDPTIENVNDKLEEMLRFCPVVSNLRMVSKKPREESEEIECTDANCPFAHPGSKEFSSSEEPGCLVDSDKFLGLMKFRRFVETTEELAQVVHAIVLWIAAWEEWPRRSRQKLTRKYWEERLDGLDKK